MKLIGKCVRVFDRTNEFLFTLSGILILSMFIIMLVEIGARLMDTPLLGSLRIIEYGLLYFTFLGAAYMLKIDGHIRMDLLVNSTKPETRHLINIFTSILSAILWLGVTAYSAYAVWDAIQLNLVPPGILRIPKAVGLGIIPFGGSLLFIQSVRKTISYMQSFIKQKRAPVSNDKSILYHLVVKEEK